MTSSINYEDYPYDQDFTLQRFFNNGKEDETEAEFEERLETALSSPTPIALWKNARQGFSVLGHVALRGYHNLIPLIVEEYNRQLAELDKSSEARKRPFLEMGNNGYTPLCLAVDRYTTDSNQKYFQTVKVLIKIGAKINGLTKYDETPMHIAALKDNRLLIKFFMIHGGYVSQSGLPDRSKQLVDDVRKEIDQENATRRLFINASLIGKLESSPYLRMLPMDLVKVIYAYIKYDEFHL